VTEHQRRLQEWGIAALAAASDALAAALPSVTAPHVGPPSGDQGTGPVHESRYVHLTSPRLGPLSVWLFVVSAGHVYDPAEVDQLGAGLMRGTERIVGREMLGSFSRPAPFPG